MRLPRWFVGAGLILILAACSQAVAPDAELELQGSPSFAAAIWGDGELWATTAVTLIPAPNAHNDHSFDVLYVITNSNNPNGQLPVSEAAPGNPMYNGGRWFTHTVMWTPAGFDAHGTVPVLTSYDDVMLHETLGHLSIVAGSPPGGPPPYFECPLLPVK